jgi:hypothetical protein
MLEGIQILVDTGASVMSWKCVCHTSRIMHELFLDQLTEKTC